MPMLVLTVSTTKRNDMALLGIALLACGLGLLATGAGLAERLVLAAGLWGGAVVAFLAARRG